MAKKSGREGRRAGDPNMGTAARRPSQKPSVLLDTRVIYCGDNLEQLGPCRTGQYRDETKEKRAVEDRHENTKAYIDYD